MKLLTIAVTAVVFFVHASGLAQAEAPPAHVTILATLNCKGLASSFKLAVQLDDVIVSGRRYYPEVQTTALRRDEVQLSFDVPGSVYELDVGANPATEPSCAWNGPLLTLPGVSITRAIKLNSLATLWDRGDFVAGTIEGAADVAVVRLPQDTRCGQPWPNPVRGSPLNHPNYSYSAQLPWLDPSTERPAIEVTSGTHTTVVALAPLKPRPLQGHVYLRRDITANDLLAWSKLPSWTVICANSTLTRSSFPDKDQAAFRTVYVTAVVACSDRNDLYQHETPDVEVENQLHRGQFYFPNVHIRDRHQNVIHLWFRAPPGAYDLGMRLPKPKEETLGCSSTARFALLPGQDRHLSFLLCTCGDNGSNRGFLSGKLDVPSIDLAVTMIPSSIPCGSEIQVLKAVQNRRTAALDGGYYYATFDPYDPSLKPVLLLQGPLGLHFVALPPAAYASHLETSIVRNVTVGDVARWSQHLEFERLICDV